MTPFTSLLLPVGLSALAVVILPMLIQFTRLHRGDYRKVPDEDAVMASLRAFNIPPDDYMVPHPGYTAAEWASPEYDAKCVAGPVMIVSVGPNGPWNMGRIIAQWLLFALVVSASVGYIVGGLLPPGGDAHAVFHPVALISFLAYAMGAAPLSIWYRRKWSTTFKNAVDALVYAVATGWIFMWLWPKG